ncbi:molybdopterin-dependent oxidoreductase [Vibrio hepatarius]|uniref:molybdopterin-dependent oxidoreductase n=1 Tax=Vibrio hepatarius TaxID=171383 RepID=UPI0020CA46DF|nr:molybdopterin-dependent oxidoreductase [Vibrio hepatarius]
MKMLASTGGAMGRLLSVILAMFSFQAASSQLVVRIDDQQTITLSQQEIAQQFKPTTFHTQLPWFEEEQTFTGFRVADLLEQYGIDDYTSVWFIGLNDYSSITTKENIIQYDPIVTYEMDGESIPVRKKGPFWLMFNLSKYPELDKVEFHAQMVWQLKEIVVLKQ